MNKLAIGLVSVLCVLSCKTVSSGSSSAAKESGNAVAESNSIAVFQSAGDLSAHQIDPVKLYTVNHDVDAKNCEFYVNAFGKGGSDHNSAHSRWIEGYLSVNESALVQTQGDTILNAGMYVKYHGLNADSPSGRGLYLAAKTAPAYYKALMQFEINQHGGTIVQVRQQVDQIAFFIDIKRKLDGSIDRVWLTNGGTDFTMASIFDGYPTKSESLGTGSIEYVKNDTMESPIFNQKKSCATH